jgi:PhnB protein
MTSTETATGTTAPYQPAGFHTVIPYICVTDTMAAIDWYERVLGAVRQGQPIVMPDGRIGHAEFKVGDSSIMIADEFPEIGVVSPLSHEGTAVSLTVYVPDADATWDEAVRNGATPLRPVEHQFYGARSGHVVDPWGHRWAIQTQVETVTDEEHDRRADELFGDDVPTIDPGRRGAESAGDDDD